MDYFAQQRVFARAGLYRGPIDGIVGSGHLRAARRAEIRYALPSSGYPRKRRLIAAAQGTLTAIGFNAGYADGYTGPQTRNALVEFDSHMAGVKVSVQRKPIAVIAAAIDIPHQKNVRAFYGAPAKPSNMEYFKLPFSMRIDWNLTQKTSRLRLHKKCGASAIAALTAAYEHYGEKDFRALGLDRYAGGYNPRKMRRSKKWSMHAYGCALDIYAGPNSLDHKTSTALFAQKKYAEFLDIMEAHGWLSAGRMWGYDYMHFQMART